MPVEFMLGADGIPYAVEFANVSIWPRRPEPSPVQLIRQPPKRSKTLPSVRTQKPLPPLPSDASRSGSLRRVLRRFSEPAHRLAAHEDTAEVLGPVRRRSSTTCSRAERDEKTRNALQALLTYSMSEKTFIDLGADAEEPALKSPVLPVLVSAQIEESSDDLNIRSGGLHVAFRGEQFPTSCPKGKESAARLRRLTRTIAEAVAAAGMVGPPERTQCKAGAPATLSEKALFRGTYGQVRTALHDAGLAVKKCDEQGFEGASRVGTLFVANHDRHDNLIFTKVVLYSS